MNDFTQQLQGLLKTAAEQGASDIHISPGHMPMIRIDSRLIPISGQAILDSGTTQGLVTALIGPERQEAFKKELELDFSYTLGEHRFRVNAYHTQKGMAAGLRNIPLTIRSTEELGLPEVVKVFTKISQGFVLVVGPNGHGKSTTLASLIDLINKERAEKIITIEDPIEYIFNPQRSVIDQRELGRDSLSFHKAIESALRQNVNVIMVGEMRDHETMSAAVTAAETGHLVFASLHTNSASQTIERIIDSFPPNQQSQIRTQLANSISGIISQRLIPRIQGGLIPAVEVMVATSAVRTLIRDNRAKQIDLVIETGQDMGMIPLNRSLANLVRKNEIAIDRAEFYSTNPIEFRKLI